MRNPYPDTILFKQCPRRTKPTFYYLRLDENAKSESEQTLVLKEGNVFRIFSNQKIGVMLNQNMIDPNQPVTIVHNGAVTAQRQFQPRPDVAERTMLERVDPYYIFEDEIVSVPQNKIDVNAAICQEFNINKAEKDAEYEGGLPKKPEQTPATWSKSMKPLVSRTAQLPQRFISGWVPGMGSNVPQIPQRPIQPEIPQNGWQGQQNGAWGQGQQNGAWGQGQQRGGWGGQR